MKNATLAVIELANHEDLEADLGEACMALVLSEFARRVEQFRRERDELVESAPHKFCIWLRDVAQRQQIELAAAKLERLMTPPISIVDEEIRPQFHAAFVPPVAGAHDTDARMRLGELGIREARSRDLPWIVKDTAANDRPMDDHRMIHRVTRALEEGEFTPYFQPKVNAGLRNVTGCEALLRWHPPGHNVIGPGTFMPAVAKGGLLPDLTWYVLKAAIAQCRKWPDPIGVAVNVPPAVLLDGQLEDVIRDALAIYSVAPERLTLEITEDAMAGDPTQIGANMRTLRELGARLSIDDFGTGYSSLSHLQDLPIDELKIDRSFVQGLAGSEPRSEGILAGVVALARGLELHIVAEGVEDESSAVTLATLGCDTLQGYLFGKAMPADQFRRMMDG